MKKNQLYDGDSYFNTILSHYEKVWNKFPDVYLFDKGPIDKLPFNFRVLEFSPNSSRNMWTYATCCLSKVENVSPIELHIFSEKQDSSIIELLTALAYYHNNTNKLKLNN